MDNSGFSSPPSKEPLFRLFVASLSLLSSVFGIVDTRSSLLERIRKGLFTGQFSADVLVPPALQYKTKASYDLSQELFQWESIMALKA